MTKEAISKMKRQTAEWEKSFANDKTNKALISKLYKQFNQLIIKNTTRLKMSRRPKQTFLQRRHTDG